MTCSAIRWALAFVLLAVSRTRDAAAFVSSSDSTRTRHVAQQQHRQQLTRISQASSDDNEPYSVQELDEMDNLIISLSLEPTDESRRQRLVSLFHEKLATPGRKRFTDLFDQVLVLAGNRVQIEAQKKALESVGDSVVKKSSENAAAEKEDEEDEPEMMDEELMDKKPEEKQLWALVDMMVQSKTITKKVYGNLGTKGTFQ